MKIKWLFFSCLSIGILIGSNHNTAQAAKSCEAVLCMSAMAGNGSVGGGCSSAISSFFKIQVWGPTGFKPNATAKARKKYLMSCPGAAPVNSGIIEKIIALYGRMIGF